MIYYNLFNCLLHLKRSYTIFNPILSSNKIIITIAKDVKYPLITDDLLRVMIGTAIIVIAGR